MKNVIFFLVSTLCLLLVEGCSPTSSQICKNVVYPAGTILSAEITNLIEGSYQIMGMGVPISMETKVGVKMALGYDKVSKVPGMTIEITDFALKSQMPGIPGGGLTVGPDENGIVPFVGLKIGKPTFVSLSGMDAEGLDMNYMSGYLDSMANMINPSPTYAQGSEIPELPSNGKGSNTFGQNRNPFEAFTFNPMFSQDVECISPGHTFSDSSNQSSNEGNIEQVNSYEYIGMVEGRPTFNCTNITKMGMASSSLNADLGDQGFATEMNQTLTGEMSLDPEYLWIHRAKLTGPYYQKADVAGMGMVIRGSATLTIEGEVATNQSPDL